MRKTITVFFILTVVVSQLKAQYVDEYPINEGNGNLMIEIKNYQECVRQFTELCKKNPENMKFRFKLGKCYTYSNLKKEMALTYLEGLTAEQVKEKDFGEVMATAYFKNYQFDEAKKRFKALADTAAKEEDMNRYRDWMKKCDFAQKMVNNPVTVYFENLGKNVNSKAPDFLPVVQPDESSIYFTTRRQGVVGNLYSYAGYRTADIFVSKHRSGKYTRARSVGSPNTYGNEFTGGRSENGNYLTYIVDSEDNFNDIFVSQKGRRSYMPPKIFADANTGKKTSEQGSTLTNDGERMFFSSDRPGGIGGHDIYYVQRLPTGNWSPPINLGKPINTEKDEKYPLLMNDDMTLYFSSDGHQNMGGMDLFKSDKKEGSSKWSEPKNLGYPINSTEDDLNISFSENERYAYMAKNLDDSFGDLDIYRLTFEEKKEKYTLVFGGVMTADSVNIATEIEIEVFDNEGELVGTYKNNTTDGNYSAILAPGIYSVEVADPPGYAEFKKKLRVSGKNDQKDKIRFDIILSPK